MACLLGIDHGGKRIGLAVSDAAGRMALPVCTIEAKGTLTQRVEAVLAAANEYEIDGFVVGLPLNMDDSEGPQAKLARTFGEELGKSSGKPVHYQDERLSSATADERLQSGDYTRKKHKARRDRISAQIILQQFLDEHAEQGS